MLAALQALEKQVYNVYNLCTKEKTPAVLLGVKTIFLFYVRKIDHLIRHYKLVEEGKIVAGYLVDPPVSDDPFPRRDPQSAFCHTIPNKIVDEKQAIAQVEQEILQTMDISAYLNICQQYRLLLAEANYSTEVLLDQDRIILTFDNILLGRGAIYFNRLSSYLEIELKLWNVDNDIFIETAIENPNELKPHLEEWKDLYGD